MLKSEWYSLQLTGTISWSVLGDVDEVARIRMLLEMFNGTIVGVYKRKTESPNEK